MKKDFILTFLTQIIVLLSGLAVFKLAMIQFGDIGFSEFSIVKRNSTYLYTFIVLGLGITVPRYIAMEIGTKSGNENNVFLSAFVIMIFSLTITSMLLLFFQEEISFLLFGDQSYTKFLFPIFISIVGLSFHSIVYAYFRGKMIFITTNLLQIINMSLIPLAVFIFAQNIEEVFLYSGLIMAIINLIILIKIFLVNSFEFDQIKEFIPKLFVYSIQRMPATFGLASLLALPAIFTAHTDGVIIAGYVAFSISLLSLSGQAVAPIGLIMLPKISHLLGEKNFTMIQYYVKKLLIFSLFIVIMGTATYQFFAEDLLHLYLGEATLDLINISKNIMWGALFYPFFVTLRSVVDAYYVRAYNTVSILVSLVVFLLIYLITRDNYNSLIIALSILSLMTFYFIKPILFRGQK